MSENSRRSLLAVALSGSLASAGCLDWFDSNSTASPLSESVVLEQIDLMNAHEIEATIAVQVVDDADEIFREDVTLEAKEPDTATVPTETRTERWGDEPMALNVRAKLVDLGGESTIPSEDREELLAANEEWLELPPREVDDIEALRVSIAFGFDPGSLLIGSRPVREN